MIFIISLVLVTAFALLCDKPLKKHPNIFYIGTAIVALFFGVFTFDHVNGFVKDYVLGVFQKGALSTAFFVLVMYAGALKNGSYLIKKLMPIRAQLSIMGAILILIHNFTYGRTYFVRLFTNAGSLQVTWLLAAIISMILLLIMIPLTIMSFPIVRKKIKPRTWKRIQRLAYIFYVLIYVHVMLVNVPMAQNGKWIYAVNVIVYSVVFITYAVLRIRKAVLKRKKEITVITNISFGGIATVLLAVVCCLSFIPMVQSNNVVKENIVESSETSANVYSLESKDESVVYSLESQIEQSENSVAEQGAEVSEVSELVSETTAVEESVEVSENVSEQTQIESSVAVESSEQKSETTSSSTSTKTETSTAESSSNESTLQSETSKAEVSVVTYKYKNGTYTGQAEGYDGYIYATITIENDIITSISASSDESDQWYFNEAQDTVIMAILNSQNTSVDAVSGATYSSNGIMNAVKNALKKAEI